MIIKLCGNYPVDRLHGADKNKGGKMERIFLKDVYSGTDGDDFRKDFVDYLETILINRSWDAMSEYKLYLQGAKKAIEEIIEEIKNV